MIAERHVERLRKYLAMISAKHGGIKAMIARTGEGALESMESAAKPNAANHARRRLETSARGNDPSEEELHNLEAIMLTGVTFPTAVVAADRYKAVRGAEVARRAGARRKRRKAKQR